MKMDVKLTFFCELETEPLQTLFSDASVIGDLKELGAGVSLGLLDLSPERAAVASHLQAAGIPIIAWLLLPKKQGYWFNSSNVPQALARYEGFKSWSVKYGLDWQTVGMDIEMDLRELEGLLNDPRRTLPGVLRRVLDRKGLWRAQAAYRELVIQMHVDGYYVNGYHFPLIVDERKAGSSMIQRLMGLVDVGTDREVLMLYSSMFRPYGHGILWSYAPQAGSVGLGVTGGGVQIQGMAVTPALNWEELSRDLRLARHWTDDIHVFSLEGCVEQGFLGRLKTFDWQQPTAISSQVAKMVERVRRLLYAILWASARPMLVLASLLSLAWLFSRLRKRR
jgi:hypothetical protein